MAINRASKVTIPTLPEALAKLIQEGFYFQQVKDGYTTAFKAMGEAIKEYLENNTDGFTVDMGKGFKSEQGTVIFQSKRTYDYDGDAIEQMVADGDLTVAQLLGCMSGFRASDLEKTLGNAKFQQVATEKTTEYLTMRANAPFKAVMGDVVEQMIDDGKVAAADTDAGTGDAADEDAA